MFVRLTVSELHEESGQPLGIFHAIRYLRDGGKLTAEQEEVANEIFNWAFDHLEAPGDDLLKANPGAVSWFRLSATGHIAEAERFIPILMAHGYHVATVKRTDPGRIIYSDSAQVLALP
jgi:hypothetical protein